MSTHIIRKITEDTLIPISLLIVIIGGVFWFSSLWSELKASTQAIAEIKIQQDKYNDTVQSIDKRLYRIEGKLGAHGE